jgi:hypothetical protein
MADPGDAWVDATGTESSAIIGDARSLERAWRDRGGHKAADDKVPARPAVRPPEIWVRIAKAVLNMVRRSAGKWLRLDAPANRDQQQRS